MEKAIQVLILVALILFILYLSTALYTQYQISSAVSQITKLPSTVVPPVKDGSGRNGNVE